MDKIWNDLYQAAKQVLRPRKVVTLGELTPKWWI